MRCAPTSPSDGGGSTACSTRSASRRRSCLGGDFLEATWDGRAVALQISAYSFKALADCFAPLMTEGGRIVGLDFDASVAWPAYDWMGVAKAALESTSPLPRPRARPKGIRVNLVAAGPIAPWRQSRSPASPSSRTCGPTAHRSVGTSTTRPQWRRRAWRCCPTGSPRRQREIVHVDGGYHAMAVTP